MLDKWGAFHPLTVLVLLPNFCRRSDDSTLPRAPLLPSVFQSFVSHFFPSFLLLEISGQKVRRMWTGPKAALTLSSAPVAPLHLVTISLSLDSFYKVLSTHASGGVTLSRVCIHFTDERIPGSKHPLEKSPRGGYRLTNSCSS